MKNFLPRLYIFLVTACLLGIGTAPALAITETFTFEEFEEGTFLNRQLEDRGVVFPGGVEVDTKLIALTTKGIIPLIQHEFEAQRIRIGFTAPQHDVRLLASVRPRLKSHPSQDYVVKMDAYAWTEFITGPFQPPILFLMKVASTQQRIIFFREADPSTMWVPLFSALAVTYATGIDEVVVYLQKDGLEDNNGLFVDNLVIEGDVPPPPPPTDTAFPVVSISRPFTDEVFDSLWPSLSVVATDDQFLERVSYTVFDESGNPVPGVATDNATFCGDGAGGPCPDREYRSGLLSIELPGDGAYSLTVRACDSAGNCTRATRRFSVNQPPPPVPVIPGYVEVNQGVHHALTWFSSGSGTVVEVDDSIVPFLAGKTTVVRWYLFGDGGTRPDFRSSMSVYISYLDGTDRSFNMSPNTGTPPITVPQDPGSEEDRDLMARWQMRPDLNQTLNFVIPGTLLENADFLDINLDGFGSVQFRLQQKLLGLNLIYIVEDDGGTGARPTRAQVDNTIINYLKIAYPVSDVQVVAERNMGWDGSGGLFKPDHTDEGLLHELWWVYGDDDAPATLEGPAHTTVLGVVTQIPHSGGGGGGIAYLGPGENTALTTLFGDTAAQEIGHNMGFVHLSNFHGEDRNDQDWEQSPYPHAVIADHSGDFTPRNFGVIPQAVDTSTFLGQWNITLVDPCPGVTAPPCDLPDDQLPHEFMSYGSSPSNALAPLTTQSGAWVSNSTYQKFYASIPSRGMGPFANESVHTRGVVSTKDKQEKRAEALLISGEVGGNGFIKLYPLLRKPLPGAMLSNLNAGGPYTLELYDAGGKILVKQPFELAKVTHSKTDTVKLAIPYIEGIARLVIRKGQSIVADEKASPNLPQVKILEPRGGMEFSSGIHTIKWEAYDPDKDPLTFLVQYSPDGGKRWQGIDLVAENQSGGKAAIFEANFDVNELIPGSKGLIRVTASDGFNTTVAITAGAFSVGAECDEATNYSPGKSFIGFNYRKASGDKASLGLCINKAFCDTLKALLIDKEPEDIVLEVSGCAPITIPGRSLKPNSKKTLFLASSATYILKIDCVKGWLKLTLKNVDLKKCVSNPVKTCIRLRRGTDILCLCAEEKFIETPKGWTLTVKRACTLR